MENYEKLYKQALENAKRLYEQGTITESLAYIFPELKESEDEKIRKALLEMVHDTTGDELWVDYDVHKEYALAWLEKQGDNNNQNWKPSKEQINALEHFVRSIEESGYISPYDDNTNLLNSLINDLYKLEKQGEQKPTDKVVPKFKVGDWVVPDKNDRVQIKAVNNEYYTIDNGMYFNIPYVDKYWHLWTIQDAKDGDVLALEPIEGHPSSFVTIYKKQNGEDFDSYCFVGFDGKFYKGENGHSTEEIHPATKEQRDLLLAKMKEAGYEFDFEKKELKKIDDEIEIPFGAKDSELQEETYYIPKGFHAEIDDDKVVIKRGEKPATWGDEDESCINNAIAACRSLYGEYSETAHWLKSLKDRVQGKEE